MEKVIRFAYTDKVEDVDLELLEAAHHFKISRLFATCELKLCKLKQGTLTFKEGEVSVLTG